MELRRKLVGRGFDAAVVDAALAGLVSERLCCDIRFTESFVASRIAKGQGPLRIRVELEQRGVDAALVEAHLERDDSRWAARAAAVRERRFGPARASEPRAAARQSRFLARRGFTTAQIGAALRAAATAAEDDERW